MVCEHWGKYKTNNSRFRNQRGQNALKEMLQPLVMDVITDKNIRINTNPIEVYKVWVNQQESETGKTR
jgi:hypothetical protein